MHFRHLHARNQNALFYHKAGLDIRFPINWELGIAPSCYTLNHMEEKRKLRLIGRSFAAAGRKMLKPEVPRDAAGISYFSLVAIFPAMLVLIALADTFLGWLNLHNAVIQHIVNLFPGSRQDLKSNLNDITAPSLMGVLSCMLVVLWSSSWIFTFIENSINRAWGISHQRTFWESRLRSAALMFLGGFSLLISAAITGIVGAVRARTAAHMVVSAEATYVMGRLWYFFMFGTGLLIAVLVFAMVFKWTPHCKVFWKEAFSGALVSTALWEIGSFIFVKLVPVFDYQRIYGKMGAIIALLAWVYTSNLILIFGANFSAQLHWTASAFQSPRSGTFPRGKPGKFPSHI
jgi:membrane protein